jgi:hypothetical protein
MTTEAGKGHDADWRNLRAIGESVVSEYGRGRGRVSPPIEMLGKALTLLAEAGSNYPSAAIEAEAARAALQSLRERVEGLPTTGHRADAAGRMAVADVDRAAVLALIEEALE